MKSRDWLVQQGLAKPNSRGRLSKEAKEALNKAVADGQLFSDLQDDYATEGPLIEERKTYLPIPSKPRTHDYDTWTFVDKGTTSAAAPLNITLTHCGSCGHHVGWCRHDEPLPPKWLHT